MSRLSMKDGRIVIGEQDEKPKNTTQKTNTSNSRLSMVDGRIVLADKPAANKANNQSYMQKTQAAQREYQAMDDVLPQRRTSNVMDMAIDSLRNRVANSTIGRAANEWTSRVSGNIQNVLNESPEYRAAKRQARADNEARRQQFAIDTANIIDQASAQYEGPTRAETVRGRFTDTEGADMFSNDWEPGEDKEVEYTRTVRNENYNPLSREDRDALISRYADAVNGKTDANGYQQVLYDVTKNGGIEQLYREQQADAANDREYGRQLRGVDLDSMNFWQRLGGTLGGTVAGAGEQIASSGLGLYASNMNTAALNAANDDSPASYRNALDKAATNWYYGLVNGADDPGAEENIRRMAAYVGGDSYADDVIRKIRERAEEDIQSGGEMGFSSSLLDEIESDNSALWRNLQGTIEESGVYDAINQMQASSQKHIQYAKDVNLLQNQFGDNLVEAGVSTIQNAADAALAATLGLSGTGVIAMIPFALRAYGGSYAEQMQQATELGGVIGQDVAKKAAQSAGISSAIEVGTEMMWGIVGAMSKVTGGGALDDAAQQKLAEILSGWAKTEAGKKIITTIGEKALGGITEGLEEVIGDAAEQILKNAGIMPGEGEEWSEWVKNAGHSFITGALGGLMGEVTGLVSSPMQQSQIGKQLKAGSLDISLSELADLANSEGMENTSLAKAYSDVFSGMPRNIENISDLEAGKLYTAYEEMLGKRSEAIDRIEQMQAKVEAGEELTRADVNRITNNSDAVAILAENGAVSEDAFKGGINERRDAVEMALRAFANDSTALSETDAENVQAETENANTAVSAPNPFLVMSQSAIDNALQQVQPMSTVESLRAEADVNASNRLLQNMARSIYSVSDAAKRLGASQEAADTMARLYSPSQGDTVTFTGQAMKYVNQGGNNEALDLTDKEDDVLTPIQKRAFWNVGRMNYLREVSQNGETKQAENGELRVHDGGEWNDSAYSAGSLESMAEVAGGNPAGQSGYQQPAAAAQGIRQGAVGRRIASDGVDAKTMRSSMAASGYKLVDDVKDQDYAKVKKIADSHGYDLVAWRGGLGNFDGTRARGLCKVERNDDGSVKKVTLFVQLDNDKYTAEQTAIHEATHGDIATGKITLPEAKTQMIKALGGEDNFYAALDAYADAYHAGGALEQDENGKYSEKDLEAIFEEMVCDAPAGMNAFAEVQHFDQMRQFRPAMSAAKAATENRNPNGTRGSPAERGSLGKASIDLTADALGVDAYRDEAGKVHFRVDGREVKEITADHVKERSAIGVLIKAGEASKFITAKEAEEQYKAAADLMNMIMSTQDPEMVWAFSGATMFSALKKNSDGQYGTTIDFTTVCRKTQEMVTAMSNAMREAGRGLTKKEVTDLQHDVLESGAEVPCPVCYVFSRWAGIGGMLDDIVRLQDKYAKFTKEQITARTNELKKEIIARGLGSKDKKGRPTVTGSGATALMKELEAEANDAKAKIEWYEDGKKGAVTEAEYKRLKKELPAMQENIGILSEWTWSSQIVTRADYKAVPKDILFDLDAGAKFASEYPAVWKYRTTRGPSSGKAILPYSSMRTGDIITGAEPSAAVRGLFTDIVTNKSKMRGKMTRKQDEAYQKAVLRTAAQNLIGGQRYQSTSDFRYEYALDYIQSFWELQALGSKLQTYTKVVEYADIIASVGGDVNLSVMPLRSGVENGKLIFSNQTGMNIGAALEANRKFDNAQLILVGINDEHILAALDDHHGTGGENIGFVIPYHASGASITDFISELVKNLGERFVNSNYRDYSAVQNDKEKADRTAEQIMRAEIRKKLLTGKTGVRWNKANGAYESNVKRNELTKEELDLIRGKSVDISDRTFEDLRNVELKALAGDKAAIREYLSWSAGVLNDLYEKMYNGAEKDTVLNSSQAEHIMPHEYWNTNTTRANAYVNGFIFRSYCYSMGLMPRFSWSVGSGENAHGDLSGSDGYWKTLIDRPMYNNDGTYRAQQRINVTDFNNAMLKPSYAEKTYPKYKIQEPNRSRAEKVGTEFGKKISGKLSRDLDSAYMAAAESGDTETAQRLVKQAAKDAGMATDKNGKLIDLYHGTPAFGWTQYKDSRHSNPFIYTSTKREVSAHYAGDQHYAFVREIGKKYDGGDSLESIIKDAKGVWGSNLKRVTNEARAERIRKDYFTAKAIADKVDSFDVSLSLPEDVSNALAGMTDVFYTITAGDFSFGKSDNEAAKAIAEATGSEREEFKKWIDWSLDYYDKSKDIVRDYYGEHRKDMTEDERKFFLYVMSYDVSDAIVDFRYGISQLVGDTSRLLMDPDGGVRNADETRAALDDIHNIGSYHLYGNLGENPFEFDANGGQFWALKVPEISDGYVDTDTVSKWALDHGYTSVVMRNIYDYGDKADNYVFFSPEQIKSADPITYDDDGNIIPLEERFNPKNDDIRYSRDLAPAFYSKLEREIEAFKGDKIGASSAIQYLKGKGVKDEDIKWSGIATFLEGKKSVGKAELLKYLKSNRIKVKEVMLDNTESQYYVGPNGERVNAYSHFDPVRDTEYESKDDFKADAIRLAERDKYSKDDITFTFDDVHEYWSAEVDGDLILEAYPPDPYDLMDSDMRGEFNTIWDNYTLDGGSNYREILFTLPDSDYINAAMRTHWRRPGVLAHARIQDFESNGLPVLFVDEIQSDWHNEGTAKGYEGDDNLVSAEYVAKLRDEWSSAVDAAAKQMTTLGSWFGERARKNMASGFSDEIAEEGEKALKRVRKFCKEWGATEEQTNSILSLLNDAAEKSKMLSESLSKERHGNPAPDAPFRNGTYVQFVLKDLLRKAAEGGYDYLAWTTGKMQEDRWSSEYAEGYRIEYDQDIPAFLKKYGKQWGATLTKIMLDQNGETVPAIAITGEMKDSVLYEGQPMFSRDLTNYDLVNENRELQKAVTELRSKLKTKTEQYKYWKGQTKVTEGRQLRTEDVTKLAREIIKGQESSADAKAVAEKMKALGEYLLNSQDENVYDEARLKAYEVAHDILANAKTLNSKGGDDFYGDFRTALKNQTIYVAPSVREEVAPDGWNDFRKAQFGTVNMTADQSKGKSVDKVYHDLQATFGEWLLPEYITSEADQLNKILEIIETYRPVYENLNSYEMADAVEWTANEILTRIIGEEIRETNPTYADRMEKKLADQKAKAQTALKQVRQQRDRKVADLKAHYQQVAEDRRNRKIDSEMRSRLLKIAKRLNNKKLDRVTRGLLDQYIGELDLVSKGILGRTVKELETLQAWYDSYKESMGDDFIPDKYIERKIARLSKKHISDLTQEEVADLTTVLLNLETMIRTQNQLIESQIKMDAYAAGVQTIDDINNSNGRTGFLNKYISTETATPEREIHRITGYRDSSPLYKAAKELSDGQRKMLDYQRRAEALFKKWTTDKKFIRRIAGKHAEEITVSGYVNGQLTDVKITPAMRMALYLHEKNDDNMRHISKGGVKIPDMALYKKGKLQEAYDKATRVVFTRGMLKEIASKMSADEKAFADAVDRYYNGMSRNEINDTSEALRGYAIAGVEHYYPIDTDGSFLKKEFDAIKRDGSIEGMGILKERIEGATNPIMLYDMNDTLNRSISQHSKYVGLAIPVRNFNKLYGVTTHNYETSVAETLKKNWGSAATSYIEKMMADVQNGTGLKSDAWGDLLARARSKYAGAVLTTNASVAMKQAASYPTAAAVVGYKALSKALADFRKYGDKTVDMDKLAEYTPLYWYRSKGFVDPELGDIGKAGGHIPKALNWIQGIDMLTTRKLAKAAMYYVLDNNKDLVKGTDAWWKEVAKVYNRIIEETQPNYTMMQRPQILRSDNALTRALNMFKTQPFQNFNILYDAFGNLAAKSREYKANTTEENLQALKSARANAARAVSSQAVSALVFALMQWAWDAFRGKVKKYRDDDGEKDLLSWLKGMGINVLSSAGGMIPFGSYVLELGETMTDAILKAFKLDPFFDQTFYGMSENASSSVNDMGKAMINMVTKISQTLSGGEVTESTVRSVVDSMGDIAQFAGIPVNNVIKLAQSIGRNVYLTAEGRYVGGYHALRLTTDPARYSSDYYDLLWKAYNNDKAAYDEVLQLMLDDGFEEDKIKSAMEKRMKDAQGVSSVKDLESRWMAPSQQKTYDEGLADLDQATMFQAATDEQQQALLNKLYNLAVGNSDGKKLDEKIKGGASVGLDQTEYLLFQLALSMSDADGSGKANQEEAEAAALMVPGLSPEERAYLFQSVDSKWKNNPFK